MNKKVNSWIEGDGTVRTVVRSFALWNYSTQDRCKVQLVKAIEKENALTGPFLVQHVVDRRKNEIQWISLYIPLFAFSIPILLVLFAAFLSHIILNLYLGIGLMAVTAVVFRMTCFSQYQEARRFIYQAGDCLLRETDVQEVSRNPAVIAQSVSSGIPYVIENELVEKDNSTLERNTALTGTSPNLNFSAVQTACVRVLPLDTQAEEESLVSGEALEITNKGCIKTILLHELVKKECGRPSIYSGDIHKSVQYYSHITGCQPKNILDKTKYYKNRESMNLTTPNARTTHKKYLELLLQHYAEIGDDKLYNQAEDLQSYIENATNRKN